MPKSEKSVSQCALEITIMSFSRSVGQSVGQSIGRSDSLSVGRSFGRSVSQSVSQSVNERLIQLSETLGVDYYQLSAVTGDNVQEAFFDIAKKAMERVPFVAFAVVFFTG